MTIRGAEFETVSPDTHPDAADGRATRPVLYIEDDESNRRLMARVFSHNFPSLDLLVAARGSDGVSLAFALNPALILLDGQLPDMTGEDVVTVLRSDDRTRETPIVMVSGSRPVGDASKIAGHLVKPIDLAELRAVVATWCHVEP